MGHSDFTRTLRWQVATAKEKEARDAAKKAAAAGDIVAAAHHEARARRLRDEWHDPEIETEVISQLRQSLGHPDPDVRESARNGLEELGIYSR